MNGPLQLENSQCIESSSDISSVNEANQCTLLNGKSVSIESTSFMGMLSLILTEVFASIHIYPLLKDVCSLESNYTANNSSAATFQYTSFDQPEYSETARCVGALKSQSVDPFLSNPALIKDPSVTGNISFILTLF
jgi:hypothetical protein